MQYLILNTTEKKNKQVYSHIIRHAHNHGIFLKKKEDQSVCHGQHSTETDCNELLLAVILIVPDLNSAFNTLDHCIKDTALADSRSYLWGRSFSFIIGEFSWSPAPLTCAVPQGSILGLLLFSIHLLPLGQIICQRLFHCHDGNTQWLVALIGGDASELLYILVQLCFMQRRNITKVKKNPLSGWCRSDHPCLYIVSTGFLKLTLDLIIRLFSSLQLI